MADDFDFEAYVTKVRGRLGTAAQQRDALRQQTLAPLTPIHDEISTAQEQLRNQRAALRAEKERALSALSEQAQRRRTEASEHAAKILQEADEQAKGIRREAKRINDLEREQVIADYDKKLAEQTRELEDQIATLQRQETEALNRYGGALDQADEQYRSAYDGVVAERILTRKALAGLGFTAPRTRKKNTDEHSDEQKVAR